MFSSLDYLNKGVRFRSGKIHDPIRILVINRHQYDLVVAFLILISYFFLFFILTHEHYTQPYFSPFSLCFVHVFIIPALLYVHTLNFSKSTAGLHHPFSSSFLPILRQFFFLCCFLTVMSSQFPPQVQMLNQMFQTQRCPLSLWQCF
jgi:hypothetical protein